MCGIIKLLCFPPLMKKADDTFISWLKLKRESWNNATPLVAISTSKSSTKVNSKSIAKSSSTLSSHNSNDNTTITLKLVKEKVSEIINLFGVSNIEKTCKWFLLWNNR